MIIKTDQEGMEAIKQLCDIALKVNGLSILQGILGILNVTSLIEDETVKAE